MAGACPKNGPSKTNQEAIRLETYRNQTKTTIARGCHGRSKKKLKVKNWKETTKDRRTWRDLAQKAKTHKGLQCQMMIVGDIDSLASTVAPEVAKQESTQRQAISDFLATVSV